MLLTVQLQADELVVEIHFLVSLIVCLMIDIVVRALLLSEFLVRRKPFFLFFFSVGFALYP